VVVCARLARRRDVGAQMLEVIVWGYENDREADEHYSASSRELSSSVEPALGSTLHHAKS